MILDIFLSNLTCKLKSNLRYIFFPIHDILLESNNEDPDDTKNMYMNEGGSHWSLMVFAPHLQRFFYFDSMGKYNFSHAQIIASKTARFLQVETKLPIQTVQVPQQSNSVDCGIFTLIFTDILV